MIIVSVIVTVSTFVVSPTIDRPLMVTLKIIVTIFDIIFDILCCNCFGGRTKRTGTHSYRFGRRGAAAV